MSVNTNNPVTFTMPDNNISVVATFETSSTPPTTTYTVNFGTSGSGSVTPSGTQYYNPGATVNITASPASGWAFVQWQVSGNISIANYTSTSTTATINGNGSVTALFE